MQARSSPSKKLHVKQQGVSLVVAVFILVVLSLLGAAMINILAGGAESVAREVISTRALFAAESGAQKKLNLIFPPGAASAVVAECDALNPDNWGNIDGELGGIEGCSTLSVVVSCSFVLVDTTNYFTINSVASCGPNGEAAVRVIEVQARDGL